MSSRRGLIRQVAGRTGEGEGQPPQLPRGRGSGSGSTSWWRKKRQCKIRKTATSATEPIKIKKNN